VNEDISNEISQHISAAIKGGKTLLTLEESKKILELTGIPIIKSGLAKSGEEAVKLASEIGYPLVMKIVSPQISHKTEVGGVRININSEDEVKNAYIDIITNVNEKVPEADIQGILLQEMLSGPELIVGITLDPQFGHMIMFGIGGIFVEVYKDVSFRLVPITLGDAKDMLNEINGRPILEGVRGLPKVNDEQLVDILMKVSDLVSSYPNIKEMDLNPLIASEKGVIAVDARIILSSPKDPKDKEGLKGMVEDLKKLGL